MHFSSKIFAQFKEKSYICSVIQEIMDINIIGTNVNS